MKSPQGEEALFALGYGELVLSSYCYGFWGRSVFSRPENQLLLQQCSPTGKADWWYHGIRTCGRGLKKTKSSNHTLCKTTGMRLETTLPSCFLSFFKPAFDCRVTPFGSVLSFVYKQACLWCFNHKPNMQNGSPSRATLGLLTGN